VRNVENVMMWGIGKCGGQYATKERQIACRNFKTCQPADWFENESGMGAGYKLQGTRPMLQRSPPATCNLNIIPRLKKIAYIKHSTKQIILKS